MKTFLFLALALVGCMTGNDKPLFAGNVVGDYELANRSNPLDIRLRIFSDLSAKVWVVYPDSVSKDSTFGTGSFKGDTLIFLTTVATSGQVCKSGCRAGYLYSGDTLYSVITDTVRLKSPVPIFVKIPTK